MRIFGNNKVLDWVQKKGMADDEALTHRWLNKALETAQGKVEARNFEIRKNLLRFDDVMNSQRQEIYKERIELMATEDVSDTIAGMRRDVVDALVTRTIPENVYAEQWKIAELKDEVQRLFGLDLPVDAWAKEEGIADEEIKTRLNDAVERLFAQRAAQHGSDVWRQVEKSVLMQLFDQSWKDHLLHLDHLRQGIGLRAYGQKDPLNEYKREAFNLFNDLLSGLREQVVSLLATLQLRMEPPPMPDMPAQMQEIHEDPALATALSDDPAFDPADPDGGGVATLAAPARGQGGARSQRSLDLGQGRAQCPVPLRLGQEVQALPRQGLTRLQFALELSSPCRSPARGSALVIRGRWGHGLIAGSAPLRGASSWITQLMSATEWRAPSKDMSLPCRRADHFGQSASPACFESGEACFSAICASDFAGGLDARLPTPPSSYDDDTSPAALGRLGLSAICAAGFASRAGLTCQRRAGRPRPR